MTRVPPNVVRVDCRPPATATPAFEVVFEAEFDHVWNALRRLGVAPADLEDVTHEVFIDVYRKLADYDPSRPMGPWIMAFAYHAASNHRRRVSRRMETTRDTEMADHAPSADERMARAEGHGLIAAALDALDSDRRVVFVLHELEECTMPEIAAMLGIPLNTAYSRLRLAREEVAKFVARRRARQERT